MADNEKKGRVSQPLALKYRPNTLADLLGQKQTVDRIKGILKTQNIPNAILLAGPSGCGKTTTARILARTINCEKLTGCGKCKSCIAMDAGPDKHPDYKETNAANERGIDDIRAMIQKAKMMPQIGNFRIFLIDEAQQLTPQAAQALLKPLEEPSARTLWLIGSMEPERLLEAIRNRCQTFNLQLLGKDDLTAHLKSVSELEEHEFDDEIYDLIADLSGGHARAALQGLESVIQYVDGLDKPPKDLTAAIKQNVIEAALIESDDHVAVKVIRYMLEGNMKGVAMALLDCQNHIGLAAKMLIQVNYCVAQLFGVTKHRSVWHTPTNKASWEAVADGIGARAEKEEWDKGTTAYFSRHALLTISEAVATSRSELQSFIVPEFTTSMNHYCRAALELKQFSID